MRKLIQCKFLALSILSTSSLAFSATPSLKDQSLFDSADGLQYEHLNREVLDSGFLMQKPIKLIFKAKDKASGELMGGLPLVLNATLTDDMGMKVAEIKQFTHIWEWEAGVYLVSDVKFPIAGNWDVRFGKMNGDAVTFQMAIRDPKTEVRCSAPKEINGTPIKDVDFELELAATGGWKLAPASSLTSENSTVISIIPSELGELAFNTFYSFNFSMDNEQGPIDLTGVELSVSGGMDGHYHGLGSTPPAKVVDAHTIAVSGVKFMMPGEWFLDFVIKYANNTCDFTRLKFEVQP